MSQQLFAMFLEILAHCDAKGDAKMLRTLTDNFGSWYKKATVEEQGEYTWLVHCHMRGLDANGNPA